MHGPSRDPSSPWGGRFHREMGATCCRSALRREASNVPSVWGKVDSTPGSETEESASTRTLINVRFSRPSAGRGSELKETLGKVLLDNLGPQLNSLPPDTNSLNQSESEFLAQGRDVGMKLFT